ncbi:SDR family NAD(P)-dependent oxidoreductase [Cocleimonas flava]|uniref:Polysaccharide biosynthesis protein n=1 Tax=Cocleimonas flava TaxID=634765 RepID=A0A4R1FCV8_9GAMM|nr:polysaccharide biosynthesis protein [Cocleimonas flava]TCJ88631.1 polysaccharide biosynthesis protein [Cocleimonas flava]
MNSIQNKNILITGACGTVGSELVKALLCNEEYKPKSVVGLDNNESELFFIDQLYLDDQRASFHLADIRDRDVLTREMQGIDIVFHAAALKHVILCERSPYEAVQTNITGCQNIIYAAEANNVEKVIFTSSDKAVNPTNVMGTSKLMGERLMTAANGSSKKSNTIFASTRFGNVLGSNGSVIPIFKKQIQNGGPITLTDIEMTRFVMTVEESVRLVIDSAQQAKGGEVFITKMPVLRIADMAKVMIELLAKHYGHKPEDLKVNIIGSKPGEKLYEELMSDEETRRAVELEQYFSVLPAFRGFQQDIDYKYKNVVNEIVDDPYISSEAQMMTPEEIKDFLISNNLLGIEEDKFGERYWPGDKEEKQK